MRSTGYATPFTVYHDDIVVDVIRVQSYVDSSLEPTDILRSQARVSMNKIYLVPEQIAAGFGGRVEKVLKPAVEVIVMVFDGPT